MPYTPGPFSAAHFYLQWGGSLPGGDEWSCGMRMAANAPGLNPVNDPTALANAATAIEAFHSRGTSYISPRALLTFTKLNLIGTDGKYVSDTTLEHIHANVPGGGTDARTPPNQIAVVVSLLTGFSRGPAHRGRFYVPLPAMVVGTDGRADVNDVNFVKTSANTLIAALNASSPNYKIAVMSRKLGSPTARLVTGVEVGRVLDTQRRRRNKLAEAY